ncbi:hypothetical protein HK101_004412, partial [Irineochytrium annulatum]
MLQDAGALEFGRDADRAMLCELNNYDNDPNPAAGRCADNGTLRRASGRSVAEEGTTLDTVCQRSNVPPFEVRQMLALDVAESLALLHEEAPTLAHGELRGGNVVVVDDGFGAYTAKLAASSGVEVKRRRASGSWFGKSDPDPFVAPELKKSVGKPTPASDIYALGTLLKQIACWRAPSTHRESTRSLNRIIRPQHDDNNNSNHSNAPDGHHFPPDVPESYRRLVERCRAANPAQRPTIESVCLSLRVAGTTGGGDGDWVPVSPPRSENGLSRSSSLSTARSGARGLGDSYGAGPSGDDYEAKFGTTSIGTLSRMGMGMDLIEEISHNRARTMPRPSSTSQSKALFNEGATHLIFHRHARALRCFQQASDLGDSDAQLELFRLHSEGAPGVPACPSRAQRYLEMSAAADNPVALEILGRLCLYGGDGFVRDPARGCEVLARAVRLQHKPALVTLRAFLKEKGPQSG